MSEIMGKIKIMEDKIITTKENLVETWSRFGGDDSKFISYKGVRYKILKEKEIKEN